ncbi:hypothetical protein GE061_002280 [Apolygus lucorum]|uniref:Autophagy-related protein 9 n=1 Tax=Apolygus lucorum TaxID=248454 RepID=A0A8S9X4L8_APOLU|nr:hypothetical protein GE061_002280 [Apolygus lucorum]
MLKREPGTLGVRRWSLYGRLYLRHFNELDHELNSRLNRAYRPATKYMNIFTSPVVTVIAKNVVFICGACLAALLALSVYDEDVLTVEHILSSITILGAIVAGFRVLIPDEHLIWWPEHLMNAVLAHVHYLPARWRGLAHTQAVRAEFTQLFQYTATYLLIELISPIATPLVLLFYMKHKALDLVDFYRSFTVEVAGVGDVCSFAQMDVRQHGDPSWNHLPASAPAKETQPVFKNYTQAEEGKTELSLVHFTLTNPEWMPPDECNGFVSGIKEQAKRQLFQDYPLATTMSEDHSLGMPGHPGVSTIMNMMEQSRIAPTGAGGNHVMHASRNEGPIMERFYQQGGLPPAPSIGASVFTLNDRNGFPPPIDLLESNAMDMSINALYLHQMHHRTLQRRGVTSLGPGGSLRPPGVICHDKAHFTSRR